MGDTDFRLFYSSLFPSPPPKYHDQFTDLLTDISGWPTVSHNYSLLFSSWIFNFFFQGWNWIPSDDPDPPLLASLSSRSRVWSGGEIPAGVFHTFAKVPRQKVRWLTSVCTLQAIKIDWFVLFRHMTDPDKSMAKFLSSVDILVKCTEMQHMFFGIEI